MGDEKAPDNGEAIIWADIDIADADNKQRPDGTDIMASRRPDLYEIFRQEPQPRQKGAGAEKAEVATFQPLAQGAEAIAELIEWLPTAEQADVKLITLPELFHLPQGQVEDIATAASASVDMVSQVSSALNEEMLIATTIVSQQGDDVSHSAVLIDQSGIILEQPQLHTCGRHPWVTKLGDKVVTSDQPWGRVGLVVGSDAIYPETFRLLVIEEAEVVAVSTQILEPWENSLGLLERSAENRMNLVIASQPSDAGTSMILASDPDFTLWTTWHNRPFDGNINTPIVSRMTKPSGGLIGTVHPAASANRTISQNTNVVENRPWWLADALLV